MNGLAKITEKISPEAKKRIVNALAIAGAGGLIGGVGYGAKKIFDRGEERRRKYYENLGIEQHFSKRKVLPEMGHFLLQGLGSDGLASNYLNYRNNKDTRNNAEMIKALMKIKQNEGASKKNK